MTYAANRVHFGARWRTVRAVVQRFRALWLLGWSLVRTVFALIFTPRGRGLARFESNYAADRLLPVPATEQANLRAFSGCIACGRCNEGRYAGTNQSTRGMMNLVLAGSRSMPDFDAAVADMRGWDEATLAELERRCPTRVPFRQLVSFVRSQA
jgi:hypothetical protein